jgi:chemotaxis response regulator CheB
MPVELITEGLPIQPNHVFIVPANRDLHLLDGMFRLRPMSKPKGWPDVITIFLRSLAQNWGGKLIAVIVSGLDADGADALREIKEAGGITMAQAPDTAEWSDMPASAIKTGYIDHILPIEDIARKIAQIANEFPGKTT